MTTNEFPPMTMAALNAYRLHFKNGTMDQVSHALCEMSREPFAVPNELLAEVIDMMHQKGVEGKNRFPSLIQSLIGKTRSTELYRVADELGYLQRAATKVYLSPKVDLFVNQLFYQPDLETLVLDELYLWLTYVEQTVWALYRKELPSVYLDEPDYDERLKKTEMFGAPLWPIGRILQALEQIGSARSRESLLGMEHYFRPRINKCLEIELKRACNGEEQVIKKPVEEGDIAIILERTGSPTVYHLREVIDRLSRIARSEPTSASGA
jgi:hypothetical protein